MGKEEAVAVPFAESELRKTILSSEYEKLTALWYVTHVYFVLFAFACAVVSYTMVVMHQSFGTRSPEGSRVQALEEKDGVKIYTRKDESSPHMLARGIVNMETSLAKFEDLMCKPEQLFSVCDPEWTRGEVVEEMEPGHVVCYRVVKLPFPLKDRDLCWYHAMSKPTKTDIVVIGKSVDHHKRPANDKCVRGDLMLSGYVAQELEPNKIRVEYVVQFNPGGWVPGSVFGLKATDQLAFLIQLKKHLESQ